MTTVLIINIVYNYLHHFVSATATRLPFSCGSQYVVCSSSIYGFWLPLWYLQTLFSFHKE